MAARRDDNRAGSRGRDAAAVALTLWVAGCGQDTMAPRTGESERSIAILADDYEGSRVFESKSGLVATNEAIATEPPFADLPVVNDEAYDAMYFEHYGVNPTIDTSEERTSTFSIDVDTASYAMARSYLQRGAMPPEASVRVEEFVNAFDYDYQRAGDGVFDLYAEATPSPSRPGYHLLHLGVRGRDIDEDERRPANLVFVVDVSGSMDREDRLGLVKKSLTILLDRLRPSDQVGLVVYGDRGRVLLEPTAAEHRRQIRAAIDQLRPGGSTNAQEGIELGYRLLEKSFLVGGINRVILCSDGVANSGRTNSAGGILDRVRSQVDQGITISTVGFGMGNYNDILMEKLAQHGNGNYHYVDTEDAARELFDRSLTSMLEVIAHDVKIQIEFDPQHVSRFRLLGYENRRLEREDFDNDFVDAGEIGPGHTVTALYEIKLDSALSEAADSPFASLRLRYKAPGSDSSTLIERSLGRQIVRADLSEASPGFTTAACAGLFAEKLRGSYWTKDASYALVDELIVTLPKSHLHRDEIRELRELVALARRHDERADKFADAGSSERESEFDHVPVLR